MGDPQRPAPGDERDGTGGRGRWRGCARRKAPTDVRGRAHGWRSRADSHARGGLSGLEVCPADLREEHGRDPSQLAVLGENVDAACCGADVGDGFVFVVRNGGELRDCV